MTHNPLIILTCSAWLLLSVSGVCQKSQETQPKVPGNTNADQVTRLDALKRRGQLNVDALQEKVLEVAGKPDEVRKMPEGERHIYGTMAIDFRGGKLYELVKLAGSNSELLEATHFVHTDLIHDPNWHIGIREQGDGQTTTLFFRAQESIAEWTEMVTIERFVGEAMGKKLSDVLEIVQGQIKANAPNAVIIVGEQDESTCMFAVNYPAREGRAGMQQLVRLWLGSRDVHRLAYTHQGSVPSDREGQAWYKVLKEASLKSTDPSKSPDSPKPAGDTARDQVRNLAETIRTDLKKAAQYKPTEKAIEAIAGNEEARKKLQDYCDATYQGLDQAGSASKPDQTEILVFGPEMQDLPGGYTTHRASFKPSVKIYGFKYVVPGEKLGMSFDGVFEVDGKWYFLPKAHRAFRDPPSQ